jgi:hypothetical protein
MATVDIKSPSTSTTALQVTGSSGNAILEAVEGSGGNGNIFINTNDGGTKVQLTASGSPSWFNNGQNLGIGTTSPAATLDVSGSLQAQTVTFTKLPNASTAPSGADLEAVVVDTSTGILYQQ